MIETKPVNPKAGEWAERIAAQQRSGMSVKQSCTVAIDPNNLPRDTETLRKIVVDLAEQLDRPLTEQKDQSLLRELLEAQRNRKSEQSSKEQLALFEAAWQARSAVRSRNSEVLYRNNCKFF